jgi:hypothetical protein
MKRNACLFSSLIPHPFEEGGTIVRYHLAVLSLWLNLMLLTGCGSTNWNWLKRDSSTEVNGKPGSPDAVAIVKYLNDNAARIQNVRVDEMSIEISADGKTFSLPNTRLFAEKPRNFLLKAGVFGKDEVEIGSNSQEFWFWAARNPDPYQFYCSYKDFSDGRLQKMPLPIQPEWVVEALGLGPYGPADKYQLHSDDKARLFRLEENIKTPTGQSVRKIIVMHQAPVKAPTPQITSYVLVDAGTNQEIASAHILRTEVESKSGVILPKQMELRVPSQKLKLILTMNRLAVNTTMPPTVFQRPQMKGVEAFNLATGQPDSRGVQRAQGIQLQPPLPK